MKTVLLSVNPTVIDLLSFCCRSDEMSGWVGGGGPPGSVGEDPNSIAQNKLRQQQKLIEQKQRQKRRQPGMIQANEERPGGRPPRTGYGNRDRDDSTRPLMGGVSKPSQQDCAHGGYSSLFQIQI